MTKDEEFWKELDRVYSGVIKYEVIRKHPLFQRIKVNQDKVCGSEVRVPAKPGVTLPLRAVHIHFEIPEVYVEKYDKHMVMTQITDRINLAIQNAINTMQIILCDTVRELCGIDAGNAEILPCLWNAVQTMENCIELQQLTDWVWADKSNKDTTKKVYTKNMIKYCNFVLSEELINYLVEHFEGKRIKPETAPEKANKEDKLNIIREAFTRLINKTADHFEFIDLGYMVTPMLDADDLQECAKEVLNEYEEELNDK